jgi:hypothetical protein
VPTPSRRRAMRRGAASSGTAVLAALTLGAGVATAAPADVTAAPADVTAPPADVTAAPADVTAAPADVATSLNAGQARIEAAEPGADALVPPLSSPDPDTLVPEVVSTDAGGEADDEVVYEAADGERIDAERIRDFLEGRDAPLATEAETLVAAGVEHDVDPRLVVGIAVAESSGGERLPASTHNAWGWSGTGPHGLKSWSSWEESIDDFTERLGRLYETESVDEEMARTYVPPNWRWWLETVTWVIDEI